MERPPTKGIRRAGVFPELVEALRCYRVVSFFTLSSILITSGGCVGKKLETRLETRRQDAIAQSIELGALNRSDATLPLDWNSAVKILEERNLTLDQGRTRIAQVKRARDEQWRTWLPRVGAYANLQTSLANLGDLSFSDLNASLAAPLVIPNPFSEHARALQNSLTYLESIDSFELSRRRQIVSLYRIFSQFENITRERPEPQGADRGPGAISAGIRTLETQELDRDAVRNLQAMLAQLLNLPGQKPTPLPSTRPRLDYERRYKSLVPGKNYGQLAMRLSAYQIEAALLREKGIEFQQWPTLSMSSSTPPVYDTAREDTSYLDTDQIYLFGGLSKSFDLTGRNAETIRTAKDNTEFVKKSLRQRLDLESREWLRLQRRYDLLIVRRTLAEERLETVKKRKSGGSVLIELDSLRGAEETLLGVRTSKEQLDLELWLWDEDKWK